MKGSNCQKWLHWKKKIVKRGEPGRASLVQPGFRGGLNCSFILCRGFSIGRTNVELFQLPSYTRWRCKSKITFDISLVAQGWHRQACFIRMFNGQASWTGGALCTSTHQGYTRTDSLSLYIYISCSGFLLRFGHLVSSKKFSTGKKPSCLRSVWNTRIVFPFPIVSIALIPTHSYCRTTAGIDT